jgi:hypothetical protein
MEPAEPHSGGGGDALLSGKNGWGDSVECYQQTDSISRKQRGEGRQGGTGSPGSVRVPLRPADSASGTLVDEQREKEVIHLQRFAALELKVMAQEKEIEMLRADRQQSERQMQVDDQYKET